ncbi:hypothetical protein EDB19DRAFT_2028197 [Suillus lakei]|nr:hypothetical protein EDB19DRAFT_2028197 [Suillus lakei]
MPSSALTIQSCALLPLSLLFSNSAASPRLNGREGQTPTAKDRKTAFHTLVASCCDEELYVTVSVRRFPHNSSGSYNTMISSMSNTLQCATSAVDSCGHIRHVLFGIENAIKEVKALRSWNAAQFFAERERPILSTHAVVPSFNHPLNTPCSERAVRYCSCAVMRHALKGCGGQVNRIFEENDLLI